MVKRYKTVKIERRLPKPSPAGPDPLERIETLTRTAKANWLGLLAYLAFVGVTLMGVRDADFFMTERQTDLPLIGVKVPTNLFFYIAPGLGAMLYIHLHLYLMKLWRALGELSLSEAPVGERIAPWIVSDMALGRRAGAMAPYPLRRLAGGVAFVSIFLAGPAVLAGFWWRSMPKYDELLTVVFCGLPLFAVLITMSESLRALRRAGAPTPEMTRTLGRGWYVFAASLSGLGWMTTEGTLEAYARTVSATPSPSCRL